MKKSLSKVTVFFLGILLAQSIYAQQTTKLAKIEVDGQEFKKAYKVFFLVDGSWKEAKKSDAGFIVPQNLSEKKTLSVMFSFGKYKVAFADIPKERFREEWTVGVDEKPFSRELVSPSEETGVERVFYIKFRDGEKESFLIVHERKR